VGDNYEQWFDLAAAVATYLEHFISVNHESLPQSVERASKLRSTMHSLLNPLSEKLEQEIINLIETSLSQFETSLDDELRRLPAYVVEPVGAYSFDQLINHAEEVFPVGVRRAGSRLK